LYILDLDFLGSLLKQITPNKERTTEAIIKINDSFQEFSIIWNRIIPDVKQNNDPKNSKKLNFLLFNIFICN